MKTIFIKPKEIERKWHLIDAEGMVLGRLAVKVAGLLRGKHKAIFTPNMEVGDYVIVINAEKAIVTGRKAKQKMYYHYTGYPGGLKSVNYAKMIAKKPTYPLEHAVKGMLPKGRLGRKLFNNVKIYAGSEHPHMSQRPVKVEMKTN
ncbi:MAG: 50S ribosomal protein L13 [Spirochaetales bacterium]|nr:50S ribosomal protein L13 [Spirochaetales bacterium]